MHRRVKQAWFQMFKQGAFSGPGEHAEAHGCQSRECGCAHAGAQLSCHVSSEICEQDRFISFEQIDLSRFI